MNLDTGPRGVGRPCDKGMFFTFRVALVKTVWLIIAGVQLKQKTLGIRQIAKSMIGGMLIASLLFAAALAASPELHEHFHHHQTPSHNHFCAATLLKHGQMMAGATPLLLFFVLAFLFCLPLVQTAKFSFPDLRLGFGRAPPHSLRLH